MAYKISEKCVGCGNCEPECPIGSISKIKDAKEAPFYCIDPNSCCDCGSCASVCPEEAIWMDEGV